MRLPEREQPGEWTDDRKLATVKAAGFHGFQWRAVPALAELASKHGLAYLGACDANEENYRQRLAGFAPIRPPLINIQLCDHDTEPAEAVRVWIELEKAAADLGLAEDLEVHRDTCTETPEKPGASPNSTNSRPGSRSGSTSTSRTSQWSSISTRHMPRDCWSGRT